MTWCVPKYNIDILRSYIEKHIIKRVNRKHSHMNMIEMLALRHVRDCALEDLGEHHDAK